MSKQPTSKTAVERTRRAMLDSPLKHPAQETMENSAIKVQNTKTPRSQNAAYRQVIS